MLILIFHWCWEICDRYSTMASPEFMKGSQIPNINVVVVLYLSQIPNINVVVVLYLSQIPNINVVVVLYLSQIPALLAGFVLFKTCKFFRNKEQKWQFFPQIKNIWLHFSLWHSLPQAHKLLLNLSISSWVWVVRSYNLNSPYKSSENVREVEFVGQQYKLYQLH